MEDAEHGGEREQRLNEVFESLLKGRQAERAEQQEGGEAWLEDRVASLPDAAKLQIRHYDRKLVEAGVANPAKRAELAEEKIVAFEQTYQDRRFTVGENGEHMLNKAYAKEQVVSELKELLGDSPTKEDLKRIALLNFDANGLKAVNDLSGSHEKGTEYLKRIAEIFANKNSPEAKRMQELGITDILAVTAGGDEYSVRIKSDKPIPPEAIEEAIRMYEAAIQRIDASDLVDFNDESTMLRYLGVSERQAELLTVDEKRNLFLNFKDILPAGFKMRASASGGGATLYDGMLTAMEHPSKALTGQDDFPRAVDKIVGGLWDASDKSALENKNVYKESLRGPEAPDSDRFYSKVLARTSEARVLEAKIDAMTMELKKNETMESELAKLDALMDEGVMDEAAYIKNMREIRKKYRTAS